MAVGHWCFLSKSAVFLSVSFSERFSGAVLSVQGGCLEYCSCSKTMETEVNIHIPPPRNRGPQRGVSSITPLSHPAVLQVRTFHHSLMGGSFTF